MSYRPGDERLTFRLGLFPSVREAVERAAREDGTTMNAWIVEVIQRELKARQGGEVEGRPTVKHWELKR